MNESPAFKKMKEEGKTSKAPLSEAFGQWKNAKIAIIALLGAVVGQAVVWYTGQFYALFFLQSILKVDGQSANIMVACALLLGTGFFVLFGWLSDKVGRKPIIMAGLVLAMLTYFPLFKALTWAGNPPLRGPGDRSGNRDGCSRRLQVPVQPNGHGKVHDILRYRNLVPDP